MLFEKKYNVIYFCALASKVLSKKNNVFLKASHRCLRALFVNDVEGCSLHHSLTCRWSLPETILNPILILENRGNKKGPCGPFRCCSEITLLSLGRCGSKGIGQALRQDGPLSLSLRLISTQYLRYQGVPSCTF